MTNNFNELSRREKMALTEEQLMEAVKVMTLNQGKKIPISLSKELQKIITKTVTIPSNSAEFWEIFSPVRWSSTEYEPSGLCFDNKDLAEQVAQEGLYLNTDFADATKREISKMPLKVAITTFTSKGIAFAEAIQVYKEDFTDFESNLQEALKEVQGYLQEDYNYKVSLEKKKEYLKLANGQESIAKAFWAKVETGEWPEEPNPEDAFQVGDDFRPLYT